MSKSRTPEQKAQHAQYMREYRAKKSETQRADETAKNTASRRLKRRKDQSEQSSARLTKSKQVADAELAMYESDEDDNDVAAMVFAQDSVAQLYRASEAVSDNEDKSHSEFDSDSGDSAMDSGDSDSELSSDDDGPSQVCDESIPYISHDDGLALARDFYAELDSVQNQYVGACGVCGMMLLGKDVSEREFDTRDDLLTVVSREILDLYADSRVTSMPICRQCHRSLQEGKVPKFSLFNMGNTPSTVPHCLRDLTSLEQAMLCLARPFMKIVRLKYGAFASTGNSITISQSLDTVLTSLPPNISELASEFQFVITNCPDKNYLESLSMAELNELFPMLRVRRDVYLSALKFLLVQNPAYKSVTIDMEMLNKLPENGIPLEVIQQIKVTHAKEKRDLGPQQTSDELECAGPGVQRIVETHTVQHCAPKLSQEHALQMQQTKNVFIQDQILEKAISEFTDPLFFHKAFPYLFWSGLDDFKKDRERKVEIGEWLEHKLQFVSSRFCSHPAFVAIASNIVSRHNNIKTCKPMVGRGILQKHILTSLESIMSGDFQVDSESADTNGGNSFELQREQRQSGTSSKFAKNVRTALYIATQHQKGSRAYKHRAQREIISMIRDNGGADLFHTVSSAINHWPEVQRLIAQRQYAEIYGVVHEDLWKLPEAIPYRRRVSNCLDYPSECLIAYDIRQKAYWTKLVQPNDKLYPDGGILGKIADYFTEPENHSRGEPHNHSMLVLDQSLVDAKQHVTEDFLNKIITASIPLVPPPEANTAYQHSSSDSFLDNHPCSVRLPLNASEQKFLEHQRALMIACQLHGKCTDYCQKRNPLTGVLECRFGFPMETRIWGGIEIEESTKDKTKYPKFYPRRNFVNISNASPWALVLWRANCDIQAIFSIHGALNYITKYMSKGDFKDQTLHRILDNALAEFQKSGIAGKDVLWKKLLKLVNSLSNERQTPVQESLGYGLGIELRRKSFLYQELYIPCEYPQKQLQQSTTTGSLVLASVPFVDYPDRSLDLSSVQLQKYVRQYQKVSLDKDTTKEKFKFLPGHHQHSTHCVVRLNQSSQRSLNIMPYRPIDELDYKFCFQAMIAYIPWRYADNSKTLLAFDVCPEVQVGWGKAYKNAIMQVYDTWKAGGFNASFNHYITKLQNMASGTAEFVKQARLNRSDQENQGDFDSAFDGNDGDGNSDSRHAGLEQMLNPDLLTSNANADSYDIEDDDEEFIDVNVAPPEHRDKPFENTLADAKHLFQISLSKGILDNYMHSDTSVRVVGIKTVANFDHSALLYDSANCLPNQDDLQDLDLDAVKEKLRHLLSLIRLNKEQSCAWGIFRQYIDSEVLDQDSTQCDRLQMVIAGMPGSGKTTLLLAFRLYMQYKLGSHSVTVSSFNGVAASNVDGSTCASQFMLSITGSDIYKSRSNGSYEVSSKTEASLKEKFKNVYACLIDEFSVISCQHIYEINRNLQIANESTDSFGGMPTVWFGDQDQLAPVGGSAPNPVCVNTKLSQSGHLGTALWRQMSHVVVLKDNMRQSGDNSYQQMLSEIRQAKVTDLTYEKFLSRVVDLNGQRLQLPDKPLFIFGKNVYVHYFNRKIQQLQAQCLRLRSNLASQNFELCTFNAFHESGAMSGSVVSPAIDKELRRFDGERWRGLEVQITLTTGDYVYLTSNLCPEVGLARNCAGVIIGIIYKDDEDRINQRLPEAVLVKMNKLIASDFSFADGAYGSNVVAISPIKHPMSYRGTTYYRYQLPLRLAYSITAHSCQSLTVTRPVVIDVFTFFIKRLFYIASSRTKVLEQLYILRKFEKSKLVLTISQQLKQYDLFLKQMHDRTMESYVAPDNIFDL